MSRVFQMWGEWLFLFEFKVNPTCLVCKEKIAALKENILKRHYSTKHKYQGDEQTQQAAWLKKGLSEQQHSSGEQEGRLMRQ